MKVQPILNFGAIYSTKSKEPVVVAQALREELNHTFQAGLNKGFSGGDVLITEGQVFESDKLVGEESIVLNALRQSKQLDMIISHAAVSFEPINYIKVKYEFDGTWPAAMQFYNESSGELLNEIV